MVPVARLRRLFISAPNLEGRQCRTDPDVLECGEYISGLHANSSFGDKVIDEVAYIAKVNPSVKGFKRRGLYRMKQFYKISKDDEFVTPLVTQISC